MRIKFNLCSVFFVENIAKGKPTQQSSTYHGEDSSRAVDGNKDSRRASGSCTHTMRDHQAWWRVDLEREEEIRVIKITNRQLSWERLRRIFIYVGNIDGPPAANLR